MNSTIKDKLTGVFPPVTTPFVNQKVDYAKLEANILKLNSTKLRGYMPLGSNGEFRSLTDEESLKVIEVVRKSMAKDKTLIVGTGRESAWATIEFTKKAADNGAEFASILTPFYFAKKMTDEALIRFFTEVAEHSPIPVMIYNAPKFTGNVIISQKAVSMLAQHPNIVGMKDTSQEDIEGYVKAVPAGSNFYVLAGSISKFLKGLTVGAIGGVLSCANYLPDMCCRIQELFNSGKEKEAEELSSRLKNITSKISSKNGVAGLKAAMDLLGYYGTEPRIPLLPIPESEVNEIKKSLKEEGLLS